MKTIKLKQGCKAKLDTKNNMFDVHTYIGQVATLVEVKYVPYVFNLLPPSLLSPDVEGTSDQVLLSVLDRHHLLLDRALGDELVDESLLGLSHPVGAVEALFLNGRVPSGVEQ